MLISLNFTRRNTIPRLLLLILAAVPFIYFGDFWNHIHAHFTGNIINDVVRGQWHIALISVLIFLAFLIPLSYRRKADWVEKGLVTAFFVSLFIEMYGIPLTIIFASKYVFPETGNMASNAVEFSLFGVEFGVTLAMLYALFLMLLGMALVIIGWVTLYRGVKRGGLVTHGIYRYSRHPQYLGFMLIVVGWFIGWPTILTLIFTPILIWRYWSVSKAEEAEVAAEHPEYLDYKEKVPFFV